MSTSVLVVDDERNIRTTLAHVLESEGFEVLTAATGEQAVAMCKRRSFDAVLLDVRMPGIDGIEAFRRIRKILTDVTVILMSAYSVAGVERDALDAGVAAFLRKPLDIERVLDLLRP